MIKLVRYESKRIVHSKSFWIILVLACLIPLVSIFIIKNSAPIFQAGAGEGFDISTFKTLGIDAIFSASENASLVMLIPIWIAVSVASEYRQGTLKNIASRGYGKAQLYFSKLIACCLGATAFFLAAVLSFSIPASIFWGFSEGAVNWLPIIGLFLLKLLSIYALSALAVFVASVVRSVGIAIVVNIGIVNILHLILTFGSVLAKQETGSFTSYDIVQSITSISDSHVSANTGITALAVAVVYIVAFTALGTLIYKKRDIS